MKLQFKEQDFQINAVQAVIDSFKGQRHTTCALKFEPSEEIEVI